MIKEIDSFYDDIIEDELSEAAKKTKAHLISFRLTPEQKQIILDKSKLQRISVSQALRNLIDTA